MSDLFTHLAAARLPGALLSDRRVAALLVIGTFLPDLASKSLYWVALCSSDFKNPTHSPLGLLSVCYAASLFVVERLRRPAFAALYAGALLHVAVDLLKDNLGMGSAHLLYPFSTASTEFGLTGPDDVHVLLPIDLALLGLAWLVERKVRRVRE